MAIAEKTILEPEVSKPGVPLKRTTLAMLIVVALVGVFLSSLIFSGGTAAPAPTPVVKAEELKQTGNNLALKEEEERAARAARGAASRALPAASAPAAQAPSAVAADSTKSRASTAALPPVPAAVRRDDNSAALYDQPRGARPAAAAAPAAPWNPAAVQAGSGAAAKRDFEMEAATRMARAVVFDSDTPRAPTPPVNASVSGASPSFNGSAPVKAPSEAIAPQLDALRRQLTQQGATAQKANWMKEYAQETDERRARVLRGYHAPSGLVLRQGKVIPAVLGRQINSDLPGAITAYVTSPVYDSNGVLLIPMGSALVGQYDAGVRAGQSRLMFAFERLILPNGYSFDLPAAPGSDLAGAAGMTGDVDNHFFKMFGTSLLIAVLADRTRPPTGAVTQIGASGPATPAGQVLSDVSKSILERNRTIPPTITVDQGTRINVEVVADMVFPEAYPAK